MDPIKYPPDIPPLSSVRPLEFKPNPKIRKTLVEIGLKVRQELEERERAARARLNAWPVKVTEIVVLTTEKGT